MYPNCTDFSNNCSRCGAFYYPRPPCNAYLAAMDIRFWTLHRPGLISMIPSWDLRALRLVFLLPQAYLNGMPTIFGKAHHVLIYCGHDICTQRYVPHSGSRTTTHTAIDSGLGCHGCGCQFSGHCAHCHNYKYGATSARSTCPWGPDGYE